MPKMSIAARRKKFPASGTTARELKLYIDNDYELYRSQTGPTQENLARKHNRGQFDLRKSIKLYSYLVDAGAKKYTREFAGSGAKWNELFNPRERQLVATRMAREFKAEADLGNYRDLGNKTRKRPRTFKARR